MKKRKGKIKKGVWFALLGILATGILLWEIFSAGGSDGSAYFVQSMRFNTFGETTVYSAQDGMFVRDGSALSFYNQNGTRTFRRGGNTGAGTLFVGGGYGAIVAQGNNFVDMHNTAGLLYTAITDGAISRFAIGQNGYAAAIISYNSQHALCLIDPTGRTHILKVLDDEGKLPIAIAMQNSIVAVAQLDFSGVLLNSTITLMTHSSHAGRYSAEITAISLYNPMQIIGQMHFLDSGIIAVVSNSSIFGVNSASGDTIWSLPLQNHVQAFYMGQSHFAVAYGAGISNLGQHVAGTINVYNKNGEIVFTTFKTGATNLYKNHGYLIVQANNNTTIYNINLGEAVLQMQLAGQAGFLGSANTIFVKAPEDVRIYERRR